MGESLGGNEEESVQTEAEDSRDFDKQRGETCVRCQTALGEALRVNSPMVYECTCQINIY